MQLPQGGVPQLPMARMPKKLSDIVKVSIIESFNRNKCNFCATRFELGISRSTLYRHLRKYGLWSAATHTELTK